MKKIISLSSFVFLLSLGFISCSKNEDKPSQVQNTIQEDSNPSSFSYSIPKDMLEQELLSLMEAKEEGESKYQKASIQALGDHYEITISE